jgi:hypothetical protein
MDWKRYYAKVREDNISQTPLQAIQQYDNFIGSDEEAA